MTEWTEEEERLVFEWLMRKAKQKPFFPRLRAYYRNARFGGSNWAYCVWFALYVEYQGY